MRKVRGSSNSSTLQLTLLFPPHPSPPYIYTTIFTQKMAIPHTIQEQHPADSLLLLPIPEKLPPSPLPALPSLISAFDPYIDASKASSSSPEDESIALPVLTSSMRQITRNAQVLLNAARLGAAEAREELDGVDVKLREVEYERNRVREETQRCMDYESVGIFWCFGMAGKVRADLMVFFRSAHEPIDLPNVETFIASVDQSVLDTLRKFTFLLLLQWNLLRGLLSRFCSTER